MWRHNPDLGSASDWSEAISSGSITKFRLYSQAIVVVGIIIIIILLLLYYYYYYYIFYYLLLLLFKILTSDLRRFKAT